jgi:hypothetical protein
MIACRLGGDGISGEWRGGQSSRRDLHFPNGGEIHEYIAGDFLSLPLLALQLQSVALRCFSN